MDEYILYKPKGLWHYHDFMINKYYWQKLGLDKAYGIRKNNLIVLKKLLNNFSITYWLQGKTLKGLFLENKLLDDHDDDIGIFIEDKSDFIEKVMSEILKYGFKIIRNTENMISIEKDYRYIDICLFKKISIKEIGYSLKKFDISHYQKFETVVWENEEFCIPFNSKKLLENMYQQKNSLNLFSKLKGNLIQKIYRRINLIPAYILSKIPKIVNNIPNEFTWIFYKSLTLFNLKISEFSKEEFLNLYIESEKSFNWKWRARHLNIVTDEGKHKKINAIVSYLEQKETKKEIENSIVESDTSKPFLDKSNYDMDFWWTGNNYFWYCAKYQFRKNVCSYSKVNNYVMYQKKPNVFTSSYYEGLETMTEKEIKDFLYKNPIEVRDGAIVGGKHRAFAMIGRLISNKEYIPMMVIQLPGKN